MATSPYGNKKYTTIDEYHADRTGITRERLDEIRAIVRKAASRAEEGISYNMPCFKMGKVLVYYAGYAKHTGFYPTPGPLKAFAKELAKFPNSKGAVQFPHDQPLPAALIRKFVLHRIDEVSLAPTTKVHKPAKATSKTAKGKAGKK